MRITEVVERDFACPHCGKHEFSTITTETAWCQTCATEVARSALLPSPAATVWHDVTGGDRRRFGTLKYPLGRAERVAIEVLQVECLGERATFPVLRARLKSIYGATAVDQAVWWLVDHDIVALQSTVGEDSERAVWFTTQPHRRFDVGRLHAYNEARAQTTAHAGAEPVEAETG